MTKLCKKEAPSTLVFETAWKEEFNVAWVMSPESPPFVRDPSDPKVNYFIHKLMLASMSNYMEQQQCLLEKQTDQFRKQDVQLREKDAQIKEQAVTIKQQDKKITQMEKQLHETQEEVNKLRSRKFKQEMSSICKEFSQMSPVKISPAKIAYTTPEKPTKANESENDESPSMLHRTALNVVDLKSSFNRVSKENSPVNISVKLMPPPNAPGTSKLKSHWMTASKPAPVKPVKTRLFEKKQSQKNDSYQDQDDVSVGKSGSLSRRKRYVQSKLDDTKHFAPKASYKDLSQSEDFCGGTRHSQDELTDAPKSRRKRRSSGEDPIVIAGGMQVKEEPLSPTLFDTPERHPIVMDKTTEQMDVSAPECEETFYESPAADPGLKLPKKEQQNRAKTVGDNTLRLINDYNKLPGESTPSPKFRYKPDALRRKAERAKLDGVTCVLCLDYYKEIASQLTDADVQNIINKCSRHKEIYAPEGVSTPPDFWRTDFPPTQECIKRGLLIKSSPKKGPNRHRICSDSP